VLLYEFLNVPTYYIKLCLQYIKNKLQLNLKKDLQHNFHILIIKYVQYNTVQG